MTMLAENSVRSSVSPGPDTALRALISTPVYPPEIGGPAVYAHSLARFLAERGHVVRVQAFSADSGHLAGDGYEVELVGRNASRPRRFRRFARRLVENARRSDVIVALDHLAAPACHAARRAGKPLILRVMVDPAWEIATRFGWCEADPDTFRRRSWGVRVALMRILQKRWWTRAGCLIAPSDYLKEVLIEYGVAPETIVRLNNPFHGFEAGSESHEGEQAVGPRAERELLCVARLVRWKRVAELVQEFARFPSGWRLTILGEGPERPRIEALVRDIGRDPAVAVRGALERREVLAHLRSATALVMLSSYEGMSHTILEALACGTPVVATDVGGNCEALDDGRGGLLLPPQGPWRLHEVLPRWLEGESARASEHGRQHVKRNFDRHGIFQALEDLMVRSVAR